MICHLNTYATDYLGNWSDPSKLVPFITASKATISITGITITHILARHL